MPKAWKDKSIDEKLEALREDIARALQAINGINKEQTAHSSRIDGAVSLAKEALEKVEQLVGR